MVVGIVSCIIAALLVVAAALLINVYRPTRRGLRRILGFKNEKLTRREIWDKINLIISNNIGRKIVRNGYRIFVRPYNANKNDERMAVVYCGNNITLSVGCRYCPKLRIFKNVCDITFPENTESYLYMIKTFGTMNDVSRLLGSRKIPAQENRKVVVKRYRDYILDRIL